jgi:WD40 repeat protein
MVASGSADATVKIWSKKTGNLLRTLKDDGIVVSSVAFDASNMIASGSWGGYVKLWDKNTGDLLRTLAGRLIPGLNVPLPISRVDSVAFDANDMIASGHSNKTINLWSKRHLFFRGIHCFFKHTILFIGEENLYLSTQYFS